ncbi:hypothetical protein M885DRAFT_512644 [Pelagophyceae sp. CCMP2097]|nr:hypothetical protein M885DRAFT_512644 [Pelagophyceae sp. CCMP2097]
MSGLKFAMADIAEKQAQKDGELSLVQSEVKELWRCDEANRELTRELIREAMEQMMAEIGDMREENDFKAVQQGAENKRMQDHIADMRQEGKHLQQHTIALEGRINRLEDEVVGF